MLLRRSTVEDTIGLGLDIYVWIGFKLNPNVKSHATKDH